MAAQALRADEIEQWLSDKLSLCEDLENRELNAGNHSAKLLYLKSLCDGKLIQRFLVEPFFQDGKEEAYAYYVKSFPGTSEMKGLVSALEQIMLGYVAVFVGETVLFFEAKSVPTDKVTESAVEAVVQGPRFSLTESLQTNLNIVRLRLRTAELKSEMLTIGEVSNTKAAVLYMERRVNKDMLDQIQKRLGKLKVESLQSAGELEQMLQPKGFRLLPTMLTTERPDRVVQNLLCGRIVILIDSTPIALVVPVTFFDFFTAMDDTIQMPIVGKFLISLRYIGLFLTLTLPALYVAFTSFNPEIVKMQLALLIAGSRASIPYPSFVEVLLMLLMMEFLIEASLRLPKAIGPTATTVGGLILGTAATEAGLASNIMVILVSAVAISNFVIPINMMSFSIRVVKYIFVLFASVFGLVGIVLGMVGLVMYLARLRSFGEPYFRMSLFDELWKRKERAR